MMRITRRERESQSTTLAVEGRIAGEHSDLLEAECNARLDEGRTVELDLSSVTYVDGQGAATLRGLGRQGVKIVGCAPFILEFVNGWMPR